jgi:hypothetical protein
MSKCRTFAEGKTDQLVVLTVKSGMYTWLIKLKMEIKMLLVNFCGIAKYQL